MNWVVFFDIGETLVSGGSIRASAIACVAEIKAAGFRTGVISNTGSLTRNQLAAALPTGFSFAHFEDELILLSSELPFKKPSLKIFLHAVFTANRSANRCVFIGENLKETVAAQSAGMNAIRIAEASADSDFSEIAEYVEKLRSQEFD